MRASSRKIKKDVKIHCVSDQSLFRGGGGRADTNRGRVNDFYAGKKRGGHINLCTHVRELCYTKEVRGEDQQKMCFTKGRIRRI